jgi:hypothetical protein
MNQNGTSFQILSQELCHLRMHLTQCHSLLHGYNRVFTLSVIQQKHYNIQVTIHCSLSNGMARATFLSMFMEKAKDIYVAKCRGPV